MSELISVIVPVYNVEKYLDRCIKSILNQSYINLEIILVDDGSKDKCSEICDKWEREDSRIIAIHKENGGLSDARNVGIDASHGTYLSFIDSDDYVHKDFIKILYELSKKYDSDISMCGVYETCEEEDTIKNLKEGNEEVKFAKSILSKKDSLYCVAWNKLYKRKVFQNVRYPKGKIHEDVAVIYKLLYFSNKVAITDIKLYFYFNNPNSIMRCNYSKKHLDILDGLYDSYLFFIKNNEEEYAYNVLNEYIDNILDQYKQCQVLGKDAKVIERNLLFKYSTTYKSVLSNVKMSIISKIKYVAYRFIPKLYLIVSK